jgi:hypothetical protein
VLPSTSQALILLIFLPSPTACHPNSPFCHCSSLFALIRPLCCQFCCQFCLDNCLVDVSRQFVFPLPNLYVQGYKPFSLPRFTLPYQLNSQATPYKHGLLFSKRYQSTRDTGKPSDLAENGLKIDSCYGGAEKMSKLCANLYG